MCDEEHVLRAMVCLDTADQHELLSWTKVDGQFQAFIDCFTEGATAGWFGPGYPPACPLTPDNVGELEAAVNDVYAVTGGDATYGPHLFCARQFGARLETFPPDKRLWPMFEHAAKLGERADELLV